MTSNSADNGYSQLSIPMPLQIVVEDVGWWSGEDGSANNEPFRSGIKRRHVVEDYDALIAFGRMLNHRVIAGFVVCEWDRYDRLKKVPSATWMGESWTNTAIVGPWLDEAANLIRANGDYVEIALHGVGHEYWENALLSRTEFHDENCAMRNPAIIRQHLDCFFQLLKDSNLDSSPTSFIPPGLKHSYGNGDQSFQAIIQEYGIKYVITVFDKAKNYLIIDYNQSLFAEQDVCLIERGLSPVPWNTIAAEPTFDFGQPILSLHWANLLHSDPARNMEVIEKWAAFIKRQVQKTEQWIAPNSRSGFTQLAFHIFASIYPKSNGFDIDLKRVKDTATTGIADSFLINVNIECAKEPVVTGAMISTMDPITFGKNTYRLTLDGTSDVISLSL